MKSDNMPNCPRSGKPIIDMGAYYSFPGWPDKAFIKQVCGVEIPLEEYLQIVTHEGKPGSMRSFTSKAGKPFSGQLVFVNNQVQFYREFDPLVVCPRTGKPVAVTAKAFYFDGLPKIPCWREYHFRPFTAADWVAVLANKDGATFTNFPSRSGIFYAANVRYDEDKKEFVFEYVEKH
jgi:hypothetical protein